MLVASNDKAADRLIIELNDIVFRFPIALHLIIVSAVGAKLHIEYIICQGFLRRIPEMQTKSFRI